MDLGSRVESTGGTTGFTRELLGLRLRANGEGGACADEIEGRSARTSNRADRVGAQTPACRWSDAPALEFALFDARKSAGGIFGAIISEYWNERTGALHKALRRGKMSLFTFMPARYSLPQPQADNSLSVQGSGCVFAKGLRAQRNL
jgi:hypothetical protein